MFSCLGCSPACWGARVVVKGREERERVKGVARRLLRRAARRRAIVVGMVGLLEAVSVVAFGVWFSWVWEVGR